MEKFDLQYIHDLDVMIAKVLRPVTPHEFMHFLQNKIERNDALNIIWTLAPGAMQYFHVDDFKEMVRERRPLWNKRRGGHAFLVAYDPAERLLMRWFKAYSEFVGGFPYRLHHCDSVDDAIDHLRELRRREEAS